MKTLMISGACFAFANLAAAQADTPPMRPVAPASVTTHCDVSPLTIYFRTGDAHLSAPAAAAISFASEELIGCSIRRMRAEIITEDVFVPERQVALANERVLEVFRHLAAHGVFAPEIEQTMVRAKGAPFEVAHPLARRIEVAFEAEPAVGS